MPQPAPAGVRRLGEGRLYPGSWSQYSHTTRPAALGDDGKPAALGDDGKPAALGDDGKPAALGDDGKPAALGDDAFKH